MAPEPATPMICPPHHWLIEGSGGAAQQWTCRRCGAVEAHEDPPDFPGYRFTRKPPPSRKAPG
jgi:hypothetical protein